MGATASRSRSTEVETSRSVYSARSPAAWVCIRPTVRWSSSRLTVQEANPSSATGRTPTARRTRPIFTRKRMRRSPSPAPPGSRTRDPGGRIWLSVPV